jgi:hypothetical protein
MINPKDITKNAVAICTFLELSIIDKRAKSNPKYSIPFSNITYIEHDPWGEDGYGDLEDGWIETETSIKASDTLFHSDWNWVMKVVDKIETIKGNGRHSFVVEIASTFCFLYAKPKAENFFVNQSSDTKIEAVYNACLKFIQWYNKK